MKKIMIALAIIACYSAQGQTTTGTAQHSSKAKSGDTYVVCSEEGGYYNCCVHHRKSAKHIAKKTTTAAMPGNMAAKPAMAAAKPKSAAAAPAHRLAVKHKRSYTHGAIAAKTSGAVEACRMVPFQVCKINPDRRSVTCYSTTDIDELTPSGPAVTYGDTGALPGERVNFKVKTIVVKGKDEGAYCRRTKDGKGTICTRPGLIVRDANGYYSYGEPASHKVVSVVAKN